MINLPQIEHCVISPQKLEKVIVSSSRDFPIGGSIYKGRVLILHQIDGSLHLVHVDSVLTNESVEASRLVELD